MIKTNPLYLFAGASLMVAGAVIAQTLLPQSANATPPKSRAEVEEIVREYILNNPEVLFEAADRYTARQAEEAQARAENEARENFATLTNASAGFAIGASASDAEIVVVEFFDYHCGFCRTATDFVFGLSEDDPSLRLVFQELPVVHEKSRAVAINALAAPDTDAYIAIHRALMEHGGLIDEDAIAGIARRAKIDFKPFKANLDGETERAAIEAKLSASMDLAYAIGIDGTPGFVIASGDGQHVRIVSGFNAGRVEAAIEEVRAAAAKG